MNSIVYDPQSRRKLDTPLGKVLTIGRSSECDIVIPDRRVLHLYNQGLANYISGHHGFLRFDGLSLIVFDISKNGIYVKNTEVRGDSWVRLPSKSWAHLSKGYELGFGRATEEEKYVLQLTDEERIRRRLEDENAKRFVQMIRRVKTEL